MEWTNELILEYLHLYEQETAIWNPEDPEHKNRNAVHDAWKRIEESFSGGCSIMELKKKKNSLMAIFRLLLNKTKASIKSGGEVYKPNWFAFETMARFLHDIYQPRTKVEKKEEDITSTSDDNRSVSSPENQRPCASSFVSARFSGSQLRKRLKIHDRHSHSLTNTPLHSMNNSTQILSDDEFSIAGKKLAFDLKKMNNEQRIIAEKIIGEVIFYGKLNKLTEKSCLQVGKSST